MDTLLSNAGSYSINFLYSQANPTPITPTTRDRAITDTEFPQPHWQGLPNTNKPFGSFRRIQRFFTKS